MRVTHRSPTTLTVEIDPPPGLAEVRFIKNAGAVRGRWRRAYIAVTAYFRARRAAQLARLMRRDPLPPPAKECRRP